MVVVAAFAAAWSYGQATPAYPSSSATWCINCDASPPNGGWQLLLMDSDPDTLINGVIYQRIESHMDPNTQFYPWYWTYYVRSAPDGKGYMYLLDSLAEYMTMDVSAGVGDTVFDVLAWNPVVTCAGNIPGSNLVFLDVVVMGIDTVENLGVSVVRHDLQPLDCVLLEGPYFWQAGLGTSQGAMLGITTGFDEVELKFAAINDTCYFNAFTNPFGLPGGPSCCTWVDGIAEQGLGRGAIRAMPNPNNGQCTIDLPMSLRASDGLVLSVHDITGQLVQRMPLVFNAQGVKLDLRARAKGVYHVELTDGQQRYTGTIVFE